MTLESEVLQSPTSESIKQPSDQSVSATKEAVGELVLSKFNGTPSATMAASEVPGNPSSMAVGSPLRGSSVFEEDSVEKTKTSGMSSASSEMEASQSLVTETRKEEGVQLLKGQAESESFLAGANSSDPKPAWIDLFTGNRATMKKKGTPFLLDSGEICVKIPNEVITRNQARWESFIIGQFNGNLPSRGTLLAILNGIWCNTTRDISATKLGPNSVLIRIPCQSTRQRVLNQGIWHIAGQTMFVAKWTPGLSPSMPAMTRVPVWLEFRGVPLHFFNEEGLEHVAGALGHPLYLHPSTANLTNIEVAKVFTIINPMKPIPDVMNVQFETGETHRVEIFCPWLPPTSTHCKEVGHSLRRCPTAPVTCLDCRSTTHSGEACPRIRPKVKSSQEFKTSTAQEIKNLATQIPQKVKSPRISVPLCPMSASAVDSRVLTPPSESPVILPATLPTASSLPSASIGVYTVAQEGHGISSIVAQERAAPVSSPRIPEKNESSATPAEASTVGLTTNPETYETSAIAADQSMVSAKEASTCQVISSPTIPIRRTQSSGSLGIARLYLDSSEDETEVETEEESEEEVDVSALEMALMTPMGKRILRERPVPQTIKAKEMQYVARGRGNRGRGNQGRGNRGGQR